MDVELWMEEEVWEAGERGVIHLSEWGREAERETWSALWADLRAH